MTKTSGSAAFLRLLVDEGVTHLFGNPGTTELPIMHALTDHRDMMFVLGLQEAIVVAMADGFSRASGKLVACNVIPLSADGSFDWGGCVNLLNGLPPARQEVALACIDASSCDLLFEVRDSDGNLTCLDYGNR